MQALQITRRLLSDGRLGINLLPDLGTLGCRVLSLAPAKSLRADHQLVCVKGLLIEEYVRPQTERSIEILIHIFGIRSYVDAQLADQALGDRAVRRRALDGKRTPESQAKRTSYTKFISLGVAAKVVVFVKDENAGLRTLRLRVELCSSQSADA